VSGDGALTPEPIHILAHHIRQLRRQTIDQVKVQWDNYSPHLATWEDAYDMCQQFPFLFDRETFISCEILYLLHIYTVKLWDEV
jgi:hypothetical protein